FYFKEISEILAQNGNNPLALFNVTATVYAQLRAFFEIGFEAFGGFHCIVCLSKEFPRIILFQKKLFGECKSCPPSNTASNTAPPTANDESSGSVLQLVSLLNDNVLAGVLAAAVDAA